jgi:hypothetical protein
VFWQLWTWFWKALFKVGLVLAVIGLAGMTLQVDHR